MADELVEKARALETALKEKIRAEIERGAYDQAEELLAPAKQAGSLRAGLQRLAAAPTTRTPAANAGGSAGRARAKFHLTESHLVMVARKGSDPSRKYEHAVPLDAAGSILGHVRTLGSNGQDFSNRQVIDRYTRDNPYNHPDYHVYTVTRLLREKGILHQVRRGVYRLRARGLEIPNDDVAEYLAALLDPSVVEPPVEDVQDDEADEDRRGKLVLRGREHSCASNTEAMVIVLSELAKDDPSFLQRCSQHPKARGRKRHYIARTSEELYPDAEHLHKYRKALPGGWLVATNFDKDKMRTIIKLACEIAGLTFGTDVIVAF